jgi:hypothetical protein
MLDTIALKLKIKARNVILKRMPVYSLQTYGPWTNKTGTLKI